MDDFLQELNHHTNFYNSIPLTLHNKSYSFLHTLYERILYFHSHTPNDFSHSINSYNNSIPRGKHYDIIPPKIQSTIEKKIKSFFFTRFHIANREFDIYISYPYERSTKPTEEFKYIYRWLSLACSMSICPTQKFTIYLYMLQLPKHLPSKSSSVPLSQIHVNTAFTFPCSESVYNENEIHLYRRDEWRKVLIHETFHCLGLDFSAVKDNDIGHESIVSLFPLVTKNFINLTESYAEVMAEMIMLMYIATEQTDTPKRFWNLFLEMIKRQQLFSVFQTVKILNYMHLQYQDLYNKKTAPSKQYHEETPILSYYIIKSILFLHLNEFILWHIRHKSNKLPLYNVAFTTGCPTLHNGVDKYCDFIASFYQSSKYKTAINKMEIFIKNYKIDKYYNNTLNMLYIQG